MVESVSEHLSPEINWFLPRIFDALKPASGIVLVSHRLIYKKASLSNIEWARLKGSHYSENYVQTRNSGEDKMTGERIDFRGTYGEMLVCLNMKDPKKPYRTFLCSLVKDASAPGTYLGVSEDGLHRLVIKKIGVNRYKVWRYKSNYLNLMSTYEFTGKTLEFVGPGSGNNNFTSIIDRSIEFKGL